MSRRFTISTIASNRRATNGQTGNRTTSAYTPDLPSATLSQPVHVAEYLFRRLYEVGIRSIQGVAGEHNLALLDFLETCGLSWVGNCNALNAAYSADGYARIKGTSALFTTYGAGELSALNAVAGAYAEYVPIIHVVGTPPITSQQDDLQVHHMLGNGNPNTFSDMARSVSCAMVSLKDPSIIPDQIDHAIRECRIQSRPVYIYLPSDVVQYMVEGERLDNRIDVSPPLNDPEKEDYVADVILRYLHAATSPVILVDACAVRFRARMEVHDLAERSGLPTFVTPMAKGAVSEALPNYCGVFAGNGSAQDVQERVEAADLVINIGTLKANFSTSAFDYRVSELSTIDINNNMVRVKYSEYSGLHIAELLRKLSDRIGAVNISPGPNPQNLIPFYARRDNELITHAWFWKVMARWLQPNDIILAGSGTSSYGLWETRFPPNVTSITQTLWSSPGYALPACLGASLAAAEISRKTNRKHRVILFTGDGGFQASAQEISTLIRLGLQPTIFLINNEGSATSRLLHRADGVYSAVAPWKYRELLSAFNTQHGSFQSITLTARREVQSLFADDLFGAASCLQFVELVMAPDDGPGVLLKNQPLLDTKTLSLALPPHSPVPSLSPGGLSPGFPPLPLSPMMPPPTPVSPMMPPPPPVPSSPTTTTTTMLTATTRPVSRKSSFFNLVRPKSRPGSSSTVATAVTALTSRTETGKT